MKAPATIEPMDQFVRECIDAGVPARTLLAHGSDGLEWLMGLSDRKIRICYRDEAGSIISERVSRAKLLIRASELGWVPDGVGLYYDNAGDWESRRGVRWFTAYDAMDEHTLMPLCLTESSRRRAKEKQDRAADKAERKYLRRRERGVLREIELVVTP